MSMIKVENLTFSYPAYYENIFENVSFQIDTNWKLGFVGRNGKGKTTFLHLLLGKYKYEGKITTSVPFEYFPYSIANKHDLTGSILHEICPAAEEWELIRELSYLEINAETLVKPFDILSNGEQTKVLLAALFLKEGRFLLIDEPTNHLDKKAREITASYLQKKKGFLLVSHDRHFLNSCVDHILALNKANIEVQKGNFSSWMESFQYQQKFELAQKERLRKDMQRLQQAARQSCAWSNRTEAKKIGAHDKGYIGHKAAKMMKRSKTLEKRQQQALEEKSNLLKNLETEEDLKILPKIYHTRTLASFSDVAIYYDGNRICKPITCTIQQGDRIAFDGPNGSGKSSLIKLLLGAPIAHTGKITVGTNLIISYVPQDASYVAGTLSDFAKENCIEKSLLQTVLCKMGFTRIQLEKNMEDFSWGQKKKALLAKSLCEQAHLYIWDEPLNYIDIYSRMQIEQLIQYFQPTMIFVEHDQFFKDMIATKQVLL